MSNPKGVIMNRILVRATLGIFILFVLTSSAFPQWVQTNWQDSNSYFNLSSDEDVIFARIWDSNNGGRMFFSDDNGDNWAQISSAESNIDILSLIMNNNKILAGTWEGFYSSMINDISWELLTPSGIPQDTPVCSLSAIDDILYAGSLGKVYQSTVYDVNTWAEDSNGIPANARILSIIKSGNALFASTDNSGILISTNGGINWTAINTGLTNLQISQIVSIGTKLLALAVKNGVFVLNINEANLLSGVNNLEWTADNSGLNKVNCFLNADDTLFAGTDSNGVYLSTDSGQTWIEINSGLPDSTRVWSLAKSGENIFAGTGKGIWKINPADINNYTITASASEGGSISPEDDDSVYENDSRKYTITPELGYKIEDVLVDGNSVGAVDSYTFAKVTSDHNIYVDFLAVPIYTITASAETGGTISPSGAVQVSETWSREFTITTFPGHAIDSVIVDGNSVGDVSTYTFNNITKDHTISVMFKDAPYIITASTDGNGTIFPAGDIEVWGGDSKKFTILATGGYEISDVLIDGISVGAVNSYTFSSVDDNHTISVSFSSLVRYQINCGGNVESPFAADQYYSGGSQSSVYNTINITSVTDPAPQNVYKSERDGDFTYTFPDLTSGESYNVRLHFSENSSSWGHGGTTPSSRFNVAINGTTVLSDYCIDEDAGAKYKAIVKEFTATANESGEIVIEFSTVLYRAKVGGIEIVKQ